MTDPHLNAFRIVCRASGDEAEAETAEQALAAADRLARDHAGELNCRGALAAARRTLYIVENGTYAGVLRRDLELGLELVPARLVTIGVGVPDLADEAFGVGGRHAGHQRVLATSESGCVAPPRASERRRWR